MKNIFPDFHGWGGSADWHIKDSLWDAVRKQYLLLKKEIEKKSFFTLKRYHFEVSSNFINYDIKI